jgi:hypothetical protein
MAGSAIGCVQKMERRSSTEWVLVRIHPAKVVAHSVHFGFVVVSRESM